MFHTSETITHNDERPHWVGVAPNLAGFGSCTGGCRQAVEAHCKRPHSKTSRLRETCTSEARQFVARWGCPSGFQQRQTHALCAPTHNMVGDGRKTGSYGSLSTVPITGKGASIGLVFKDLEII